MTTRLSCSVGFSLVELLIATALTMTVAAGVFALIVPSRRAFDTQFESVDMAQRLRVAVDTLYAQLSRAGAGERPSLTRVLPTCCITLALAIAARSASDWSRLGM